MIQIATAQKPPRTYPSPIACFLSGLWTVVVPVAGPPVVQNIKTGVKQDFTPEEFDELTRRYTFLLVKISETPIGSRHGTLKAKELFEDRIRTFKELLGEEFA